VHEILIILLLYVDLPSSSSCNMTCLTNVLQSIDLFIEILNEGPSLSSCWHSCFLSGCCRVQVLNLRAATLTEVSSFVFLVPSKQTLGYYLLTYGIEPFLRSCQLYSTQELRRILWNPKSHYRVHKSPPLFLILSQIDPVHTIPSYLCKIYFNILHLPTSWSS
jgi:hypothetical protein